MLTIIRRVEEQSLTLFYYNMKRKDKEPFEITLYLSEAAYKEINRLIEEEIEKYKSNIIFNPVSNKKTKDKKRIILEKLKADAKYKALRRYYNG